MTLLNNPWKEAEENNQKVAEINIQLYIANIIDAINDIDRSLRIVAADFNSRIEELEKKCREK